MVRNHLLRNIGNLTLLTAKPNPSLSNLSFDVKRPEITKSLLALTLTFSDRCSTRPMRLGMRDASATGRGTCLPSPSGSGRIYLHGPGA
jgi:hypothetical protein